MKTGFEEVYERYVKDVYRFVLYLSGNEAIAEDITSETFVRLWTSEEQIRTLTVKAYLPLSCVFGSQGLVWLMLRDAPQFASTCWAIAVGCWIMFFKTRHSLRFSGI